MVTNSELIQRDLSHIWHPCAQMKDFESLPLLIVHEAQGSYIHTNHGCLIDGISSWWCKSLGHRHPAIINALKEQLDCFEHVMAANTTHPPLVQLGEKLTKITKKQHVFFASDGSSAVEIALKLALHAKQRLGQSERKQFIALKNSYHGETLATLSISDLGIFKEPYQGLGVDCFFIDVPYVANELDPLWQNCESFWQEQLIFLNSIKDNVCALVIEPLLQGSAGMRPYSADYLKRLAAWAKSNDIYLIADEIMTGLGRTGAWLALDKSEVEADLVCLSKGLTAGALPLSTVSIDKAIFDLFYDNYENNNSFLHSHTHSANALAVSAALAAISVIEKEDLNLQARLIGQEMHTLMQEISVKTNALTNIRTLGAVVAADLCPIGNKRTGALFSVEALKRGAFLRPIGNTLYWLPPLNTDSQTLVKLAEITLNSIKAIY